MHANCSIEFLSEVALSSPIPDKKFLLFKPPPGSYPIGNCDLRRQHMVFLLSPSHFIVALPQHQLRDAKPMSCPLGRLLAVAASKNDYVAGSSRRKMPKNLRYPRRAKVPLDPGVSKGLPLKKENGAGKESSKFDQEGKFKPSDEDDGDEDDALDDSVWTQDEIEVISALFERGAPKKSSSNLQKKRALPLPTPYKTRPPRTPTPKHHIRSVSRAVLSTRSSVAARASKSPDVLVGIAKDIGALPADVDASEVLDSWTRFLRKGSLSMTIRELGHMGLPERALQTLCWAQRHSPVLFPDDRVLASTVEVLARNSQLRIEDQIDKYLYSASRSVVEAMARGFIRAGNLNMARRVLLFAKDNNRTLDPSIHAKLALEAAKDPDKYRLVEVLLDELGEREDLDLKPQDCTAVMKVCVRLGRFEAVESLFNWFKASGQSPSVVMYTMVIHGRYCTTKYREALAAVWEMEESNILLDLPAYRVVIRLCTALNDLSRAVRYFSSLKEAGFAPTYDIYGDVIKAYATSGRLAKCREICKELETAGMKLDNGMASLLLHMEHGVSAVS